MSTLMRPKKKKISILAIRRGRNWWWITVKRKASPLGSYFSNKLVTQTCQKSPGDATVALRRSHLKRVQHNSRRLWFCPRWFPQVWFKVEILHSWENPGSSLSQFSVFLLFTKLLRRFLWFSSAKVFWRLVAAVEHFNTPPLWLPVLKGNASAYPIKSQLSPHRAKAFQVLISRLYFLRSNLIQVFPH